MIGLLCFVIGGIGFTAGYTVIHRRSDRLSRRQLRKVEREFSTERR